MYQGYYEPNKSRPNLKVITEAMATRIVFQDSDSKVIADGVELIKDGHSLVLKARKEVILCAGGSRFLSRQQIQGRSCLKGSYHSPMLLELSGREQIVWEFICIR